MFDDEELEEFSRIGILNLIENLIPYTLGEQEFRRLATKQEQMRVYGYYFRRKRSRRIRKAAVA